MNCSLSQDHLLTLQRAATSYKSGDSCSATDGSPDSICDRICVTSDIGACEKHFYRVSYGYVHLRIVWWAFARVSPRTPARRELRGEEPFQ